MPPPPPGFCAQCGAALPPAARFCPQCGAAVTGAAAPPAAPELPAGERRHAVVLFADLCDFTVLSQRLDAEDVHALLARYFEIVDGALRRYGGTIDKHIGDAVMGVFGAPVSHGDDADRAVRAALDMHDGVARLARERGDALAIHVGIASGEVVAAPTGSDAHRAYTVTGEAANLAARLLGRAARGETLVSDRVHAEVAAAVVAEARPAVEVKGYARPLAAWRISGRRAARPAGPAMVGRKAELERIGAILATSAASSAGHVVLVRGEPGIGKSRLIEEILTRARARGFACHLALILDFGVGRGMDAPTALLLSLLGLAVDSEAPAREAGLRCALESGAAAAGDEPTLREMLDLPLDPEQAATWDAMDAATRTGARQRVVAGAVVQASRAGPVLIAVEDVHWSGAPIRAHLAAVARAAAERPVVLLLSTRREGDPIDAPWRAAAGPGPLTTIELGPLPESDAVALALTIRGEDDAVQRRLVARADGNPMFLVQMARSAAETSDAVPDSIQSVIQARIDRLAAPAKAAIQAAAAIGQRFGLAALAWLLERTNVDCERLAAAGLIRVEGDQCLFAHALIRDVVYATILRARRRLLHARAAAWFAERDPALQAQHLDRADDPAAPLAYLRAAREGAARLAFDDTLALASRGLELAQAPADSIALAELRAEALRELGRTEESVAAFRAVLDRADDAAPRARILIGIAAGLRVLSRIDEAVATLDQAETAISSGGMDPERARIHFLRGNLHFARGEPAACEASHARALEIARRIGDAELEARALGGLGDAAYARGRMRTALDCFERGSALCRRHGFGRIDVSVRFMIGHCRRFLHESEAALAEHRRCVATAESVGNPMGRMTARQSAGLTLVELGRAAEALADIDIALALAREIGARRFTAILLAQRASALIQLGREGEGRAAIEEALSVARDTGMGFVGPTVLALRALHAADPAVARASLAEGQEILDRGCVGHNYFWFYRDAIETSLRAGRWDETERHAQALADYTAAESLPWSDFQAARARALAAFGRGNRDPALIATLRALRATAASVQLAMAIPMLDGALAAADSRAVLDPPDTRP